MKILIIDDDELIHNIITDRLSLDGYEIFSAHSASMGIVLISKTQFDIILLDIRMPGMNGLDFMNLLRSTNHNIPVIILSSISEEETKITAFKIGADDYMVKPFSTPELEVRIKAILKRTADKTEEKKGITIGSGYFDFQKYIFSAGETEEESSKYEILILKLLSSAEGKVFTRDDILHFAWGAEKYPSNRTIDNYIVRLRDKIKRCFNEDLSSDIIESVYGSGYRLNLSKIKKH